MRAVERENSELKAAKLMSMFNGGGSGPGAMSLLSNSKASSGQNFERQVETLKVQLSEKSNDYLRLKDENESLREQIAEL